MLSQRSQAQSRADKGESQRSADCRGAVSAPAPQTSSGPAGKTAGVSELPSDGRRTHARSTEWIVTGPGTLHRSKQRASSPCHLPAAREVESCERVNQQQASRVGDSTVRWQDCFDQRTDRTGAGEEASTATVAMSSSPRTSRK